MRIGYYLARTDERKGNCHRLAAGAEQLWRTSPLTSGLGNPGPLDGARIMHDEDGIEHKQLMVQDFFDGANTRVIIYDVES